MLPEWISLLPPWLVVGLTLGVCASILIAGAFVVGDRLFPAAAPDGRTRVDGTGRRRAEIREYLDAIGEPFAEDHPVHGRTVAFFLPERDVAITFDAQAYFHIERSGTHAVLCEHEMPGHHLGRRLPFEVPDTDWTADAADPVAEAFRRLGLTPDADGDAVKTAYRDRVKEVHPDHGGDADEFRRIREAYTTARNHAD